MLLGYWSSWILCNVAGLVYPAYKSFKVMRSGTDQTARHESSETCLIYWLVFALFCAVEPLLDFTVFWVPLYYEAKLALVIWLGALDGARELYRGYVEPFLSSKEVLIDSHLDKYYDTVVNFQLYDLRHAVYFLQDKYTEFSTGQPAPKRTGAAAKAKTVTVKDVVAATATATGATKETEAADDSPTSEPELVGDDELKAQAEPKKDK